MFGELSNSYEPSEYVVRKLTIKRNDVDRKEVRQLQHLQRKVSAIGRNYKHIYFKPVEVQVVLLREALEDLLEIVENQMQ